MVNESENSRPISKVEMIIADNLYRYLHKHYSEHPEDNPGENLTFNVTRAIERRVDLDAPMHEKVMSTINNYLTSSPDISKDALDIVSNSVGALKARYMYSGDDMVDAYNRANQTLTKFNKLIEDGYRPKIHSMDRGDKD